VQFDEILQISANRIVACIQPSSTCAKTEANTKGISVFATPVDTVPSEIALQHKRETPSGFFLR
jgi:hypothetical protein